MRKILFVLCVGAWLSYAAATSAQAPAAVHVKLSLADNRTSFRIGDPIRLVMEFTADGEGYQVETTRDTWEPAFDSVSVSPDSGVRRWLDEMYGGWRYVRDYFSYDKLSTAPTRVELVLNDSVRFDRPGTYTAKVTTRRVARAAPQPDARSQLTLTTNEVTFDVRPMSEEEEAKEVGRLSDLLDAARGWQAEEKLTEELSYLTGDASAREKVRRFLNSEGRSGNYSQHVTFGLFIARDRALVLRLLEAAMRDPKTPVTHSLLNNVCELRMLLEERAAGEMREARAGTPVGVFSPEGDPKLAAIKEAYVTELAAGIGGRAGKSQTATAMTILMNLPKDRQAAAPMLAAVRPLLLGQFEGLHPFDQEYLLRVYWEQLRDPSLAPALEKMLASNGVASKNLHDTALQRLLEIAPEEAKDYVVAEIRDPKSLVDLKILGGLGDKTLPEADAALAEQIRGLASSKQNFDRVYLKQKASLAARYATAAVYGDLMQVYREAGANLPLDARAALLAYFAKHNEQEALPLIGQALGGLEPGQDFNFLPELTELYYSDAINDLLVRRLDSDAPQEASTAAYLISLHGPAGDEKVLEGRLERWREEWGGRAAEADANLQGTVERELIIGLTRAKSWKMSPERAKELQQGCVTRLCRQNFPAR